jgi:cold shock CspA family protein
MSSNYFYGAVPKRAPSSPSSSSGQMRGPVDRRGTLATGRVSRLFIGQVHGYIRLADEREVFFHRADLQEGTTFNDLRVGDAVTFELLEDLVSGARALHVVRRNRAR